MSSAQNLLDQFFDCLNKLDTSVDRCVDLFAEGGVWELPYFSSIGIDPQFAGKTSIRGALELLRSRFKAFAFSNIRVYELKNESGLFAEYHSEAFIDGTDRVYAQDYVSRIVVEGGRIKLLREYLNIISTARLLLPGGLAGVPEASS
jgi:ketosteroid isomerase-like protein